MCPWVFYRLILKWIRFKVFNGSPKGYITIYNADINLLIATQRITMMNLIQCYKCVKAWNIELLKTLN